MRASVANCWGGRPSLARVGVGVNHRYAAARRDTLSVVGYYYVSR